MPSSRDLLLLCHRYLGLLLAVFVISNGLSGSLLAFYAEIDSRLNADVITVKTSDDPLPVSQLTDIVSKHYPDAWISGFFYGEKPDYAYLYAVKPTAAGGSARDVWIDPYTGEIRGERQTATAQFDRRHLMPTLHRLHSELLLGKIGKSILATVAGAWLLTLLIGLYLAIPRNGSFWKTFSVKRGASRFRFWFDLHRSAGIVVLLVLLTMTFCAVYLNSPKVFRTAMLPLAKTTEPVLSTLPPRAIEAPKITPEAATALALKIIPDATVRGMYFHPEKAAYQLRVRLADDINIRNGSSRIFIDTRNGKVLSVRTHKKGGTAGDRFLTWMFPLHSGQAFGWFGRIIVCLAGLTAPMLAISGVYIYLRKRLARRQRKKALAAATP